METAMAWRMGRGMADDDDAPWSTMPTWAMHEVAKHVAKACGAPGLLAMSCCCRNWRTVVVEDGWSLAHLQFRFDCQQHEGAQRGPQAMGRKYRRVPAFAHVQSLPLLLRNAWRAGNPSATAHVAEVMEWNGDVVQALRLHLEAAKGGQRRSMVRVATAYYHGEGNMAWDAEEALRWFKKAVGGCNQGKPNGTKQGENEPGIVVDRNETMDDKIQDHFERQDVKLQAQAALMLGFMHLDGEGTKTDVAEAVKWFKKASSHGNGEAQKQLGVLFNTGQY